MKTSPVPYCPTEAQAPPPHDGFLFDPTSGQTYSLNDTGAYLLERLRCGQTTRQMAAALAEEFEVDPEEATVDVEDFLRMVRELGVTL
ncbi:MAG: HPr-rel-A system PqqD family peptide chaperone [Candidatus Eremiobacterota bacterium]